MKMKMRIKRDKERMNEDEENGASMRWSLAIRMNKFEFEPQIPFLS